MDIADIEQALRKKFKPALFSKFAKAINEYDLLHPGDKVAVCVSGGKDSMLMAKLFQQLKEHRKFDFDLVFLVMDPGYSQANRNLIEENGKKLQIPLTFFQTQIFDAVFNIEKSPCYLCARMRRGHLYAKAQELGCNKIALAHHYDDVIETILMSVLYSGQFETMMPKLHSTNFEGMELIRPMYLIREKDIEAWRDWCGLKFINCACRFTENLSTVNSSTPLGDISSSRKKVKKIIEALQKIDPQIEGNIFRSVEKVNLKTIISYKDLDGKIHDFKDNY